MPKYLFAFHGGGTPETEADQAAVMQAWTTWLGDLGDAMVDVGNPTGAAKTLSADGSVADGGGANPLSGFSFVSATDLDAATGLAKGCPIFADGGTVEVAEVLEM